MDTSTTLGFPSFLAPHAVTAYSTSRRAFGEQRTLFYKKARRDRWRRRRTWRMKVILIALLTSQILGPLTGPSYYYRDPKRWDAICSGGLVWLETNFSHEHFKKIFRFTPSQLRVLLPHLGLPTSADIGYLPNASRYKIPLVVAFCIMLSRLSCPRFLRPDLQIFWGIDKTIISRICSGMLFFMDRRWGHLLHVNIPRLRRSLRAISFTIGQKMRMWNPEDCHCFGFIDGTFRPICRPIRDQVVVYNRYYGGHGLKYQGVVSVTGLIEGLYGPVEGRLADSQILEESGLLQTLQNDPAFTDDDGLPYYLYGDPGYPCRSHIISPFKGVHLSLRESAYNTRFSKVRMSVAHAFGLVTQLWQGLNFFVMQRALLSPVGVQYRVAVLLTNLYACVRGRNLISMYFSSNHLVPTLREYLDPLQPLAPPPETDIFDIFGIEV